MIKVDCVNKASKFLLNSNNIAKAQKLTLPAAVALGSLAHIAQDTFVTKTNCDSDYEFIDYCSPLFP